MGKTRTILTPLFLILVIALTGMQMAAARAQPAAVGTMVICTGSGPITVMVDETGAPTGAVMICPDYALSFLAAVTSTAPQALAARHWRAWSARLVPFHAETRPAQVARARGPPSSV